MLLKSKISYNPERKELKKSMNRNVVVLDLCKYEDMAAYLRTIFYYEYHIRLLEPLFPLHLTVIKNKDINDNPWLYKDGLEADIIVDDAPELYWNDKYVWVDGEAPIMQEIADYYGVPKSYNMGHITIGRFFDYEKGILGEHKR